MKINVLAVDLWETIIFEKNDQLKINRILFLKQKFGKEYDYWETKYNACKHKSISIEQAGGYFSDKERIKFLLEGITYNNVDYYEIIQKFNFLAINNNYIVNSELVEAIKKLKYQDLKIVLVSNTGFINVDTTIQILSKYNLLKLFDKLIFSGDLKIGKPAPAFFNELIKYNNGETKDILYIGNSLFFDLVGAKTSNINNIIVIHSIKENYESINTCEKQFN